MERNLDVTKPSYSEHILSVPWPFVISRFHSILIERVHIKPFNRPALPLLFHALNLTYSVKNLSKVGFWVKYKNLFAAIKHKIM